MHAYVQNLSVPRPPSRTTKIHPTQKIKKVPTEPTEPKASDKYTSNNLQPYGPSKMGRESKIGVEVAPALPKWSRTGALSA